MDDVQELQSGTAGEAAECAGVQACAYLLELSLDWIVLRASENIHHLLGESHVTLIEEPIGKFVHAQALHDLRNLFSRLSGTTGVARAYGIRLTDDPDLVDVAFQLSDGRVILEAVPSKGSFGQCFGSVGGLASGLADSHGQGLLDNATRRMRALTGYDRVTLICGDARAQSSRGALAPQGDSGDGLPTIIADSEPEGVALFPRAAFDCAAGDALLRGCSAEERERLKAAGMRAFLRVRFEVDGIEGEFRCENRTPRDPSFEMHAAAELFAQLFAMRLEIDQLKSAD